MGLLVITIIYTYKSTINVNPRYGVLYIIHFYISLYQLYLHLHALTRSSNRIKHLLFLFIRYLTNKLQPIFKYNLSNFLLSEVARVRSSSTLGYMVENPFCFWYNSIKHKLPWLKEFYYKNIKIIEPLYN